VGGSSVSHHCLYLLSPGKQMSPESPKGPSWNEVSAILRARGPASCGRGCSSEGVSEIEHALGVVLPQSYRRFLKEFAYATWPDYIYGLWTGPVRGFDVVRLTQDERSEAEPPLPRHLVPFSPDGWGNHFCLDTSRMKDGECPVVFWDHEMGSDQTPTVVCATFLAWLGEAMKDEMELEAT
jgi:hypothetical protein